MASFEVNTVGAGNLAGVYRIVEANDGKLWYSASEWSSTDLWRFDPSTGNNLEVISYSSGYPFDSISESITDGAGNQYDVHRIGGEGNYELLSFNDAGTPGSNILIPGGPYNGILGDNVIYTSSLFVGVNTGSGGTRLSGAMNASGVSPWSNSPSNMASADCVGPDGYVYGRGTTNTELWKVNPTTGTETLVYTGSGALSLVGTDGTNLWIFDGTDVLVVSTSGTLVHNWGTLPVGLNSVVFCYRPHDALMYVTGQATSGPNMPLYSIDSSGTVALSTASLCANGVPNYSFCYSDSKTLYFSTSYGASGGLLLQLLESQNHIVMII